MKEAARPEKKERVYKPKMPRQDGAFPLPGKPSSRLPALSKKRPAPKAISESVRQSNWKQALQVRKKKSLAHP